jgi:hypothetical protein
MEGVSVHIYRAVETEGAFVCDSVFLLGEISQQP